MFEGAKALEAAGFKRRFRWEGLFGSCEHWRRPRDPRMVSLHESMRGAPIIATVFVRDKEVFRGSPEGAARHLQRTTR